MPNPDLQGVSVLITRPSAQATGLISEVQRLGGHPIPLPLLEIQAASPDPESLESLAQLAAGDLLIFVSANAVDFGLKFLPASVLAKVQVGVIGDATAERLAKAGVRVDLIPANFDSEGFLALPSVQVLHGKQVVVVRGTGGREKLGETLHARGGQVAYLEVYRRCSPQWNEESVRTALSADVITVTSGEALENLAQLARLPNAGELWRKPLVVYHARIAGRARELGFTLNPVVGAQPGDVALLAAILRWTNEQKGMDHA